jgi:hypothetical protein
MCIFSEFYTQRKALLKKGEEVPSHMVQLPFEELMAGRVQPSPHETPEEKEKHISAFCFMVEFLAPKVCNAKGWEADMCSIPLQKTNVMASDETMTKLALENMWRQWHAAPGSMEKRREAGIRTQQGTNQKGMGWSQEGINPYNELFKKTVLNQKESWAIDFVMYMVESLKERHYRNASFEEI